MRWMVSVSVLTSMLLAGCTSVSEKGLCYQSVAKAHEVRLWVDETWVDGTGRRCVEQELFDHLFTMIDEAESFIYLDLFLVNDFGFEKGPCMRPLTQELTDRLVEKRSASPEVEIVFLSDPINTVYGSVASPYFKRLEAAGVQVVWTDLNELRDSYPLYSKPWRILVKPWGVGPGRAIKNPLGAGRISVRSFLKLLNFKANHRKVGLTERELLVMSANPHSASSAHWNVGLSVKGPVVPMAWEAEEALLRLSGAGEVMRPAFELGEGGDAPDGLVEVLTERRIKDRVIELLDAVQAGDRVDLTMFYFSERAVRKALLRAHARGGVVRVILDPGKDAFGREKNGVPNRQTGAELVDAGIPVRWADTNGEQCHTKMIYVEYAARQKAALVLGSANYTRRNLDNFNAEADLAFFAPTEHEAMAKARRSFDQWWSNPDEKPFTCDFSVYEDRSRWRQLVAWWAESTGMGTF